MNLPFELTVGLRYLRAKGGRGFLSLLTLIATAGMALGVMALIVVLAVMTGFEDELRGKILGTTAHILVSDVSGRGIEDVERLLPIIRQEPDGVRCYGSPFWGELGRPGDNKAVELAAIHFLRHAERHMAVPLTPRRALQSLMPNVLFFASEPGLVARVLAVAGDLVEAVPCFRLDFRPEASVWKVVDGG